MRTHQEVDKRSLTLTKAIVSKIDSDPDRKGLQKAIQVNHKWLKKSNSPSAREWEKILTLPWEKIRGILLDSSEEGKRLRQTAPFCGIISPQERWEIYRKFRSS